MSVGGLSCSGGLHAVVIVIKQQLSLTVDVKRLHGTHAASAACPDATDDDTTIDYRYDLLDRISVFNANYVSKTSVCINYL